MRQGGEGGVQKGDGDENEGVLSSDINSEGGMTKRRRKLWAPQMLSPAPSLGSRELKPFPSNPKPPKDTPTAMKPPHNPTRSSPVPLLHDFESAHYQSKTQSDRSSSATQEPCNQPLQPIPFQLSDTFSAFDISLCSGEMDIMGISKNSLESFVP